MGKWGTKTFILTHRLIFFTSSRPLHIRPALSGPKGQKFGPMCIFWHFYGDYMGKWGIKTFIMTHRLIFFDFELSLAHRAGPMRPSGPEIWP